MNPDFRSNVNTRNMKIILLRSWWTQSTVLPRWAIAAQSLQCYFCYEATEVQSCNQVKDCSEDAKGCKTVTLSPNSGYPFVSGEELVTRDCAVNCFQSDPNALGQEYRVHCCQGNLCNNLYELSTNHSGHSPDNSASLMAGGICGAVLPVLALASLGLFI
ncbi:secreted Ly-6/uPAR-related protein 1-like [Anomaloglossus baeobatrachus]|uniref:secreted Ly-6/uPAR-related protein 1-like n=1 Tax=Anomaloglossus baeobatrachus TaxID=238106 RepID=UPI003F50554F